MQYLYLNDRELTVIPAIAGQYRWLASHMVSSPLVRTSHERSQQL